MPREPSAIATRRLRGAVDAGVVAAIVIEGSTASVVPSVPVSPPVALFASVMGIGALGLAWRLAAQTFAAPAFIGETLVLVAALWFIVLAARYVRKALRTPDAVHAEFTDPVGSSYMSTITISLALLAVGALPYSRVVALVLCVLAASGSMALLLAIIGRWFIVKHAPEHITPAWFLPIAGNAVAAFASVSLGFADVGWFLFSAAVMSWLTLGPLVFYRLIFHDQLPARLAPSLAILVSSPAVIASAYFALDNSVGDGVFRVLAFNALFFALLVLRLASMGRGAPVSIAWWGYTFPAAALAGTFQRYAIGFPSLLSDVLAWITLASATAVVVYVAARVAMLAAPTKRTS